ncbi:MAG: hypothetical protein WCO53_06770 [Deltaproteobacteria bacterium]
MKKFIIIFIAIIGLALTWPYIAWRCIQEKPIQVIILDKTVPVNNYREHKALVWLLGNLRYINKDTGRSFAFDKDYYGFFPLPDQKFEIKPLPTDLNKAELIYITDTYGVYTYDFYRDNIRGERSQLIYGGLEEAEIIAIEQNLTRKNTLIAEFNSLASPTSNQARERMENILAVKWTGWIGRYFSELSAKNIDVPLWMVRNYEQQYGTPWTFEGKGFVFVNKDDHLFVLRAGFEIGPKMNRIIFTQEAINEYKVSSDLEYAYWFDIVDVSQNSNASVLANYKLDVTNQGEKMLVEHGLSSVFPAIVKTDLPFHTYYFAGDYADYNNSPKAYDALVWRPYFGIGGADQYDDFFWKIYFPFMKQVMHEITLR